MTTVTAHSIKNAATTGKTSSLQSVQLAVKVILHRLDEDGTFQQAAALAYNTLFSLLPILGIALLVTSAVGGTEQTMGSEVQGFFFKQLGLDQIHIINDKGDTTDLATFVAARLDTVRGFVKSPQTGLIAFCTLLWGSISLMMVIERTFGRIYRSRRQRPLFRRLLLYWCILTLGPLGVAASLWFTNHFNSAAESVSAGRVMLDPLSKIAGFLLTFSLLCVMYKLVPEANVHTKSAALGAFVGAFLWEGGKYLFGLYVAHFVGYGKWYGTLGLVPLFMFWIYLTWNFVLLGLEVAYIHQHFDRLARQFMAGEKSDAGMMDPQCILTLGALLCERFSKGRGLDAEEAADELRIPLRLAHDMLNGLEKSGLVHGIAGQENCYALSRPAESITAEDLMAVARSMCQAPHEGALAKTSGPHPIHAIITELRKVESDWARTKSLRDLTTAKSTSTELDLPDHTSGKAG